MSWEEPFPRDLASATLGEAIGASFASIMMVEARKSGYGSARVLVDVTAEREQELRVMKYDDFLRTDEWKRTVYAIHRKDEGCHFCHALEGRALDVHHLTYERRGAELYDDLVLVCRRCHYPLHEMTA